VASKHKRNLDDARNDIGSEAGLSKVTNKTSHQHGGKGGHRVFFCLADLVIDDQIAALMQNVQDMAKNLDGATTEYVEAWSSLIEKQRLDLMELEQVKALLTA
jgi:hypothetical protein